MTGTSYLTVGRTGSAEIEVKRSRFICHLTRVQTEDEARAFVEEIRKQHGDAGHNCSAFVLGPDGAVQRSSDDGEPSGTAGAPMLEVLRGRSVSDVVAVVTRYFGGVLLGAGGLVRAYSDAVRAGLDEVDAVERRLLSLLDVVVSHAEAGRVENHLRGRGVAVVGVEYGEHATLRVGVAPGGVGPLSAVLAGLTAGAATVTQAGSTWVDESLS